MDSKLLAFQNSDAHQLYNLTAHLFKDGVFNCYLTSQQFNLLDLILHRFKDAQARKHLWESFINSNLYLKFINSQETEERDQHVDGTDELYLKEGTKSTKNLCAIIRYLLYEKAVDYYYSGESSKTSKFGFFEILREDSDEDEEFEDAKEKPFSPKHTRSVVTRDEANDYDDDDDDDDEEEKGEEENEDSKCDQSSKDSMSLATKLNQIHHGTRSDSHTGLNITDDSATQQKTSPVLNESDNVDKYCDVPKEGELEENSSGQLVFTINIQLLIRKPEFPSTMESVSSTEEAIGTMVHPILGTASAIESNFERQNELKLIKNFNKIYHTFENDQPNMVKRRKLERSDKQLELTDSKDQGNGADENEHSDSHQSVNKLMGLGGAANLSLKNLLGRIEENREKLDLSDLELKNLIMDVRKNRSKWASYNRIGQEELYEACEKVVLELRSYTEHSIAFLNRVSKREAPNYYQIIKKPMDLNTVMKKLKNFQYNSKTEFVDDLMLIWKNCLTYNSDPNHFLRVDAIAMQKKTLALIPLIPDIVVKDRAEVERETAAIQPNDVEDLTGSISTRGVGSSSSAKKSKKGRKGVHEDQEVTEVTEQSDSNTRDGDKSKIDLPTISTEHRIKVEDESQIQDSTELSVAPSNISTPTVSGSREENTNEREGTSNPDYEDQDDDATTAMDESQAQDQQRERNNDEDNEDLEMATWKTLTSNTRYKLCLQRSSLFRGNKIQPNEEALLRDATQMSNFCSYLDDESSVVLHRNRQYFDENDDPYLIEYDIEGGLPSIQYPGINYESIENNLLSEMIDEGKSLEELPESEFTAKKKGSNSILYDNIALMQDVRRVCFKINIIRQMQTSQFLHQSQFQAPEIERLKPEDIDGLSKLKTRDPYSQQIAYSVLEKSVGVILMANGFESTSPFCITTMTQIAEQYFGNLVKSLKLNMESNSINKLPAKKQRLLGLKDILLMSLQENGIEKPDTLYSFYKEHLTKQNKKLRDLKYRLESFLRDLLRPGIQELSENQFTDDSEQFMNGDFSNEIGEDFFGFKELGLDKEFNLLTSTIPLHLLHSKLSSQLNNLDAKSKKAKYEDFQEIQFPKLRKRDLTSQIGLLKPFYDDLLAKSKTTYLKQLKKYKQTNEASDAEKKSLTEETNNNTSDVKAENHPQPDSVSAFVEIEDPEDLIILEDSDLPQKQRNHRPKIPPNGKIAQVKRKLIATSFFIDDQDAREKNVSMTINDAEPNNAIPEDSFGERSKLLKDAEKSEQSSSISGLGSQ